MTQVSPWWAAHVYADRRPFLKMRTQISAACRAFFAARDFCEVETAILQVSPGGEANIEVFETTLRAQDGAESPMFLHTSPEFACKKMLAAGEPRLFNFARSFRNGERTATHHPEFTMLEWYRAQDTYETVMEDALGLLRCAAEVAGARQLAWGAGFADAFAAPERLTVNEAFARYVSINVLEAGRDNLGRAAETKGIRVVRDDSWSDLFSKLMSQCVEPHLGFDQPTLLYEYPACEAALARLKPGDPRVAERFELYVCGLELANGFGELCDPVEQRQRLVEAGEKRIARGQAAFPIDEDFLAALAHMAPASGVAMGFDRLVMLATGAPRIESVLWAPVTPAGWQ